MSLIYEHGDGIQFKVKVQARAARDQFNGIQDEELKIQVKAPPMDGAANQALIKFLAQSLRVAKSDVVIVRGEHSRHKLVKIKGITVQKFVHLININQDLPR